MNWTKMPTNLLNGKFDDKEILAITKYQLLYALYEEEPDAKILSRFLTKKQKKLVQPYMNDINLNVKNGIEQVQKKRLTNNLKYAEHKENLENSDNIQDILQDGCQTEQIILDKIKKDKKEKENDEKCFNCSEEIIQVCFEIYKDKCINLIPLSYERKDENVLKLLSTTLNELNYDIDKFTELCIKANKLEFILTRKISFTRMLQNYISILKKEAFESIK